MMPTKFLSLCLLFLLMNFSVRGQDFLNGDFENNTAGVDQINLSNVAFNSFMEDVIAFGSFGNVDIISSATWGGSGAQSGDWYISLTGGGTDIVSIELDAEMIAGNEYTFSYWDRKDAGFNSFAIEIGLSDDPEDFGTSIFVAPDIPSNNVWTERTVTFDAPITGSYITVQQTAGGTGDWLHIDNFSFPDCNIDVDLGVDAEICEGNSVILDATTDSATYEWQDGSTDPTFEVTEPGTYSVTVTADGCSESDQIEISLLNLPTVDLGSDVTICDGDDHLFIPVVTDVVDYQWQDGSSGADFLADNAGTVEVEVSNSCGTASDSAELIVNPNPVVNIGDELFLCEGESIILDATTANATYLWQDGSTDPTLEVDQNQTYSVTVTVDGCSGSDNVDVLIGQLPTVELVPDFDLCENDEFELIPVTSFVNNYLWQDGSEDANFTVTQGGLYSLTVSNGCGEASDNVIVNELQLPEVNLGADRQICDGETVEIMLETEDSNSILWQDGTTSDTYNITEEGNYSVIVTNTCGQASDDINVVVTEIPQVDLGEDRLLCDDLSVTLDAGLGNFDYLWSDGSDDRVLTVSENGSYSVEVINQCGSDDDEVKIEFYDCSCDIFIPNAVTLNNDGINEVFKPVFECDLEYYKLAVFNRWGEVVFETEDPQEYWLGSRDVSYVIDGVYTYRMEYRDRNPDIQKLYGHITVIR